MYTPFSKGKTFGNQETKIILCAFSHSIHSSPVHTLFVVSFGMIAQKRPKQLFFPQVCSIAEQSMHLHLFAQWILPTSKNPSGTLGPLEYVHYAPMRLLLSAILPSFLPFFLSSIPRASIKETSLEVILWHVPFKVSDTWSLLSGPLPCPRDFMLIEIIKLRNAKSPSTKLTDGFYQRRLKSMVLIYK